MNGRSRWTLVLAVACAASICIPSPSAAQDHRNAVRSGVGLYATVGDANDLADNGLAWFGSYERLFSEKLGLELMLAYVDYDSVLDLLGGLSMIPVTATLNYHVQGEGVDLFVGPTLGFAWLESTGSGGLFGVFEESWEETEFAWGGAVAIDVPFGEARKWVVSGSVRYLTAAFERTDFGNFIIQLGAGYRF